jgi:hypothetical protein
MRVFISHSAKDTETASRIRRYLAREGFKVWDPDRQLLPGSNWLLESGRALAHSDAVVFLLSGDPLHEPFARRELQYVIAQAKYEDRVVPIRLSPGTGKTSWILRNIGVIDATHQDVDRASEEIVVRLRTPKPRAASASRRRAQASGVAAGAPKTAKKRAARRA